MSDLGPTHRVLTVAHSKTPNLKPSNPEVKLQTRCICLRLNMVEPGALGVIWQGTQIRGPAESSDP